MTATSGRRLSELYVKPGPLGSLARTLLESSRWFSPAKRLKWDAVPLYSEKITEKEYRFDRNTSSRPSVVTLNEKVTKSSRLLFRLVPSARHTAGTGCGLLPTVTAIDSGSGRINKSQCPNAKERPTIALAAKMGLLPTPRATEIVENPDNFVKRMGDRKNGCMPNLSSMAAYRPQLLPTPMSTEVRHEQRVKKLKEAGGQTFHSRANGETRPNGLMDYMDFHGMLPTPEATNGKHSTFPPSQKDRHGLVSEIMRNFLPSAGQDSPQLNPLFVEEMMGFPPDWLVSPFLSGEQNP